jgi:hypothetical protein
MGLSLRSLLLVLVALLLTIAPAASAKPVAKPPYLVGAAVADITPAGPVNLGGFGLGNGTVIPDAIVGRGGFDEARGERIAARAIVFDDGDKVVALANIRRRACSPPTRTGRTA